MKKFFMMILILLVMMIPCKTSAINLSSDIKFSNSLCSDVYILNSKMTTTFNYTSYATQTASNTPQNEANDCDSGLSALIRRYWKWVMFLVPILLVVMISLDFLKAMSSGDADAINKSASNAFKRVLAAVILLALPWALDVIFGWFGLQICF